MSKINILIENARNNNFNDFSHLFLEEIKESEPEDILKEINKKINFISQRPTKKTIKKNEFLEQLKELMTTKNLDTNFFDAIVFFENSYAEILRKRKLVQGNFNGEYLIGIILKELYTQNHYLNNHLNYISNHSKILHEKIFLSPTPYGKNIDPDSIINSLSKLLTHNIHMECYNNKWFEDESGIAILPKNILEFLEKPKEFTHTTTKFNEKLLLDTGLWDIIQEADFTFRLLKEDLIFKKNGEISISTKNDNNLSIYALIARERMYRIMYNNRQKIREYYGNIDISYMQLEKINFDILLHIDIDSKFEYDGLTINEWIRSFLLLRAISNYKTNPIILTDEMLKKYFNSININNKKYEKIINSLLFKKKTPDIFDTPIIKFSDNLNLIIPFGLRFPNFINIISSILSNKDLALKNKGENFEKNAFNLFKELEEKYNFKCSAPTRKFGSEQYQFDILVEWEDFIFIFECKNRSIPSTLPLSLSDFREKMDQYVYQVNRLKAGLVQHSEDFSVDISSKTIVPVILNSLPFSLDYKVDNVIFTDYSIISRFFSERYLTKNLSSGNKIKKEIMHDQWSNDIPSANDFLRCISDPFQVKEIKDRISFSETKHEILSHKLILKRSTIKPTL